MITEINSIKDLFTITDKHHFCYFRGISGSPDVFMKPSIARHEMKGTLPVKAEQSFLLEFYSSSFMYIDNPPLNIWDQMFYAQHYGAPTRLLDWTCNPLIALYFAVENEEYHDDAKLCYATTEHITYIVDYEKEYASPFDIKESIMIKPKLLFRRIAVQSSFLSVHPQPHTPYLKNINIIPINNPLKIKTDLELIGISRQSLFPDLDGNGTYQKYSFNKVMNRAVLK